MKATCFLYVQYSGFDTALDKRVTKAVRRAEDGAGFAFYNGKRDISYSFVRKNAALRAAARVKALKVRGMTAEVVDY